MTHTFNNETSNSNITNDENKLRKDVSKSTVDASKSMDNANKFELPSMIKVNKLRWRVADIALASALAAVFGVIYWGFTMLFFSQISPILRSIVPGFASILHGVWYMSGPLALILIRKPGAAIYVNVIGTMFENILGQQYSSFIVLISAALQAIFSEIPFLLTKYRKYNITLSISSGVLTSIEYGIYLIFVFYQGRGSNYYTVHMICEIISGFVIAGVLPWVLYLAIRKTGALDNFASSRYSVTEI